MSGVLDGHDGDPARKYQPHLDARRAMNTYSRLSSANGSRAKPPYRASSQARVCMTGAGERPSKRRGLISGPFIQHDGRILD